MKVLAGAAVTGAIAGVLLERARAAPDAIAMAEETVDRVKPLGVAPPRQVQDMMAPDPLSLRGIPPYPRASPHRMLGPKPGSGLNAISWFSTLDSLDRVLSYYEEMYAKAKIRYVTHRWGNRRGYVSWFESRVARDGGPTDSTEGTLHMVSASQEGGQTMVFLSATEPDKLFAGTRALPLGVRLPAGSLPQVIDMGEVGLQRATIFAQYRVSRAILVDQLTASLADSGWVLEERAEAPDGRVSLVAKQARRVQLLVVEGTDEHSQVLVSVEETAVDARERGGPQ